MSFTMNEIKIDAQYQRNIYSTIRLSDCEIFSFQIKFSYVTDKRFLGRKGAWTIIISMVSGNFINK